LINDGLLRGIFIQRTQRKQSFIGSELRIATALPRFATIFALAGAKKKNKKSYTTNPGHVVCQLPASKIPSFS
jgi:hypothetical protein